MIALLAMLVSAFLMAVYVSKKEYRELFFKSRLIIKEIRTSKEIPHVLLEEFHLRIIEDRERKEVLYYGTRRKNIEKFVPKQMRKHRQMILYQGNVYLLVKVRNIRILLKNEQHFITEYFMPIMVFIGILLLLVMMYILLRKSLVPLKELEKNIRDYGDGNLFNYDYVSKKDEVSLAMNAFYSTVEKVERLKSSRELFIRNLFHELNTPVTKGKILAELVDEPKTQIMLDSIFTRLSLLLKELAQMEQLTSGNYQLIKKPIRIQELLDEASDLLYLNTVISTNISDEILEVDFSSMAIVFKNLIENAYKYGEDLEIKINIEEIAFMSKGKALDKNLSYYTEAFSKENETQGFGLGLYIVNEIIRQHDMHLDYRYEFDNNIFIIRL